MGEQAWALRSAGLSKHSEEMIARLESDIMDLWKAVRSQEGQHTHAMQDVTGKFSAKLEDVRSQLTTLRDALHAHPATNADAVEELIKQMMGEVNKSTLDLSQRCRNVEESLAQLSSRDQALESDRQRADNIEKTIELLVQQRR